MTTHAPRQTVHQEPGVFIFDEVQSDGHVWRCLTLDDSGVAGIQGIKDLDRPGYHIHQFSQHFVYAALLAKEAIRPERMLFLGLGAGIAVFDIASRYPDMKVDVVDIKHDLFLCTHAYFNPLDLPNIELFANDARAHILRQNASYDMVFCDLFGPSLTPPPYLLSDEFFQEILATGAKCLVINSNAHLAKSLIELAARYFECIWSLAGNNTFLICSDRLMHRQFLPEEVTELKNINIDVDKIEKQRLLITKRWERFV